MITRRDAQAEGPRKGVGPLHQQAIDIASISTGDVADLEKLEALAVQASGEEAEMIGWEIEGWIVSNGSAMVQAFEQIWELTRPNTL